MVNERDKLIFDLINKNNYNFVFPDEPTNYPSNGQSPTTIDIGINKNVNTISNIHVIHELSSDHSPVIFSLSKQVVNNIRSKIAFDYRNANWENFHKMLNNNVY